jgi:TPP-dependent pyruvate/acetoin dehydrogenase alpha subunit
MMIQNLEQYPIVRDAKYTSDELIAFEDNIVEHWEKGEIQGPVHLCNGNEEQLLEISKRMNDTDWVFSTWRSHYHALIKGVSPIWLKQEILDGRSITIVSEKDKFYASAIVSSIIPIAVGAAMAIKNNGGTEKVWCFVGDMAFETGQFYEMHKYATNLNLPIIFIVEDNGVSTNTPTIETWGGLKREIPSNVIWYNYKNKWPHYGTGKWITF